jgi:tRNA dimethylallyltransferase
MTAAVVTYPANDASRFTSAIAIAGPTASGKSALALAAAQRWPVEIVSIDSALVYRGMDIGTAKPTPAEQAQVPHHLIDILPPTAAYSAAQFVADAHRLIGEINARGRTALLVGGTMLYLKALRGGLDAMPPADATVRAAIDERAASLGWAALHAELAQVDPVTAARLPPLDAQRIQRALEVWQLTGEPISAFHGRQTTPGLALPLLALEPADRGWLHRRIAQRFAQMLADGLVAEVRALRARGDLHAGLPSMRCVGYRQAWELLDAEGDEGHGSLQPEALAALSERGIAATRQLAKRQLTWLRSMPDRHTLPCDAADATARGLDALATLIGPAA